MSWIILTEGTKLRRRFHCTFALTGRRLSESFLSGGLFLGFTLQRKSFYGKKGVCTPSVGMAFANLGRTYHRADMNDYGY